MKYCCRAGCIQVAHVGNASSTESFQRFDSAKALPIQIDENDLTRDRSAADRPGSPCPQPIRSEATDKVERRRNRRGVYLDAGNEIGRRFSDATRLRGSAAGHHYRECTKSRG